MQEVIAREDKVFAAMKLIEQPGQLLQSFKTQINHGQREAVHAGAIVGSHARWQLKMWMACICRAQVLESRHVHPIIINKFKCAVCSHHEIAMLNVAVRVAMAFRFLGEIKNLLSNASESSRVGAAA